MWFVDWFWNTFIAPWPDLTTGTLEIRDLANLAVGILGVILAGFAIKMGLDQDAVAAKQTVLLERLEELERKQAEIAERQHQTLLAQANRKAELTVVSYSKESSVRDDGRNQYRYDLRILNSGDKPAQDIYWTVFVPYSDMHRAVLSTPPGSVLTKHDEASDEDGGRFFEWNGMCAGPVYGGQHLLFAEVIVVWPGGRAMASYMRRCEYRLQNGDGRFPAEGIAIMDVSMSAGIPDVPLESEPLDKS